MFDLKGKLKENNIDVSQIRWGLTPREALGGGVTITSREELEAYMRERERNGGFFFYIDVHDMKATLCGAYSDATSVKVLFYLPDDVVPYETLVKAVNEVGAINTSGWYPINGEVESKLKELLKGR